MHHGDLRRKINPSAPIFPPPQSTEPSSHWFLRGREDYRGASAVRSVWDARGEEQKDMKQPSNAPSRSSTWLRLKFCIKNFQNKNLAAAAHKNFFFVFILNLYSRQLVLKSTQSFMFLMNDRMHITRCLSCPSFR